MKRGINKFFSILLVLCMLISMVPAAVFAATPSTLYLKPNSNWLADGARFAAYFFGAGETWASMTDSDGDGIYECAVPGGYPSVIFCRMNPGSSANGWENKWNQSSDLAIPTNGTNCYTVAAGTWDAGGGTWSTISTEPEVVDYYLFGYINGANYGCEEDAANLGSYKFTDGKLTATFTVESYVGVKTGDNANWYMTEGFQGTSKTATLINTNVGIAQPDKLYIPAGIKVTFTLTENSDGTLTLKYTTTASTCQHLYYTEGVCNACGKSCTHSWSGGTCSKCGTVCAHSKWSSGKCTTCGISCDHSWSGSTCKVCGLTCSHSWSNGKCATCGSTCTHKWSSGKCSTCGLSCTHKWSNGKCSTCGLSCTHSWSSGKCKTCGLTCSHNWKGGKCSTCSSTRDFYLFGFINGANYGCEEDAANLGAYKFTSGKLTVTFTADSYVAIKTSDNAGWYMAKEYVSSKTGTFYNTSTGAVEKMYVPGGIKVTFTLTDNGDDTLKLTYTVTASSCQHLSYTDGVCNACGKSCTHSWSNGTCSKCGTVCTHSYTSKVTTAATCTQSGVKTYTCATCKHSYTEAIAATGHSYSSGKCTVCGAADPGYSETYYLVGFINGANLGCEEDSANMGSYKFSSGKLTATFTADSYVFVKTEGNGKWYLAESYCTDTTCKLVEGGIDKLYVPGGIKVTFTLTENTDGSLTIKYTKTASTCQHLNYTDGKCNACGKSCTHSWGGGTCTVCGTKCAHSSHDQNGICSTCGSSVGHSYSGNKCTVCGKVNAAAGLKIHFVDAVVWQNVTAYVWKSNAGGDTGINSWPGDVLNKDENGYFTMELDYKPTSGESLGMIFTNFNGAQTANVMVDYSTLSSGEIWVKPNNWTNGEGTYDCYVTTVESTMYVSPEIDGTSVTFRYENADASSVYLAGSMNGWSTSANKLTRGSDGFWTTTMTLSEGVYEYKFIVDGEWILDPRNGLIGGYDGNSLVVVGSKGSATASDITVKLHFYRESGDYANWDAWMWSTTNEGQGCTFQNDPLYKGKTATFTIPGGTNAWVNYKIRKTDWSDEEFYTRSIDISNIASGTVHFFLNSGSAEGSIVYGNDVMKMGKPTYANLDYNTGNIWVKTPLPVYGNLNTAFSILKSDGSASGISVTGVTLDNYGYSLQLSRKPALIEVHDLVVKCGTTVAVETDGLFYSSGFAADYTYYGNDLGATWSKNSTTFKVWAPTATGVSVMLYKSGNYGANDWISTTPMTLGEKGVYTVTIPGDLDGTYYNFLVNFPTYSTEATDPYAKTTGVNGDRGMIINMDAYDPEGWDNDISPNKGLNYTDAIIYEMHIREMTIDSTSGVKEAWRGKYLGLTQTGTNYEGRSTALSHIKELGVTHVQLMPTYDHAGVDEYHLTDWQQYAWGYNPKNFNVPEGSFATDPFNGEVRVNEMKQMIQAFHSNGINVVMDVVYNHTFSGGDFCYNKIVPNYFSRFWGENNWSNGSGVGNDFATERSMGRNYIVDSIFYWVEEYHIDGFRFDLAGLIDIQTINEVISTVQAKYPYVIFYGEGWAVGGTAIQDGHWTATKENAWQTGSMAFYNDNFRNDIAGDNGNSWGFATGDSGKADKMGDYFRASNGWSSSPSQTINYVSCHDNYTLIDKIIISRNGAYWDQMVKMNNMSAALYMLAQGIPYIYSGEELLREKKDEWGNRYHNTYDSSDYITKIRWDELVNKDYCQVTDDYYAGLVNFRKNHAALRCPGGGDAWGYTSFHKINDHCILFYVSGYPNYECSDGIVIIYNANEGTQWLNIYDYGVPYGYWQACIHGMTAGVNPLWGTSDGSVGVEGLTTTVLVLGDLVHEESVYNNQSYSCSHAYHNQSGLCWDCGAAVSHYFVNGYCNHCNLAEQGDDPVTIYYDNSGTNWGNVYAYAWTEVGGRTVTYTNSWPGNQMTNVSGDIFAVTIPRAATSIIFTDNYGNQSVTQGIIKNDNGNVTANIYYSADGTWGTYTAACSHASHNANGICSSCGVEVGHNWSNGYCSGCKTTCAHDQHSKQGKCYTCGLTVSHNWSGNTCTGCGTVCTHSWSNGKCSVCGSTCGHDSHNQSGSCNTCGYSVGHSYVGGLCSHCSAYKAGYIESQSYYLVGFINGADHGMNADAANLGSYKFSNGKLTTSFTSDSYVAIKTGDNASYYMTDGYQEGVVSAKLYDSRTVSGDKLYVPGGKTITFTLTVDASTNTMNLSYVAQEIACSHSYTEKVTTAATCTTAGVKTFTCSKCGDSYTQTIAATGHSFSGGKCTVCGTADPDYVVADGSYVLVTDASQITAGGKFVIVANGQAMGTTLSSGKFAPVAVTIDGNVVTGDNLPVWTFEPVSGGVTISLDGQYLAYNSSTNFKMATTGYTWTVTAGTSGYILNSSATSRGIYYSKSAAKFGAYSTTYQNSSSYVSNLQLYKYQEGTADCTHSYTSSVTTAATCTTAGVKTFTCSLCGDSYTEVIAATGHNYAGGTCTACGAVDPSVSGEKVYYLFGYINGANYACEEDYENMGAYQFTDGKLTATFTADSYIGVKENGNANWYMTHGYTEKNAGIFYNTATGAGEKMFVPGNVEVTFTLTENEDGSLTVSYVADVAECAHSYTAKVVSAATCNAYATYELTCGSCGSTQTVTADALATQWLSSVPSGMSSSDFTSQTMYRYRDQANGTWSKYSTKQVVYVDSWPSGFDTSNELYSTYNNKANKVSAFENSAAKQVIDSDSIVGYLYYHWCYEGYPYSVADQSGSYNRFHAYFSNTTPDQADKSDSSDNSYRFDDSTACDDCLWYFAVPVYSQVYTTYTADTGWGAWSDWSTTKVTASATREVVSGTMYRYNAAALAEHKYSNGVCTVCGDGCSHSYSSKVTTAATCTTAGIKTYTCSICAHSYTESIAATGHSYSGGKCSVCGAADPSASGSKTYYLFGYINGANYACEENYEDMGIYKFVDGKLTVKFDSDSYVGVKTEGNTAWYMTDGWQGTDKTSVTLYNTDELFTADKFYVPGGVEVTFTLTENADGSLNLSYTTAAVTPSVAPTLSLKYPTLTFEDVITMNVFFAAENIQDVVEMGLITYKSQVSSWNVNNAEAVVPGYKLDASGFYIASTEGIAAKDMGDTYWFAVYAKLKDGTYTYTKLVSYSPTTYAYNQLSDATMSKLVIAMLNYGAAAQTYFNYKTDSLMNAKLTAAQKASIETYRADMMDSISTPSAAKAANFTKTSTGFSKRYPTITFEGAFSIDYFCQPSATVKGNITMYYWTQADYDAVSVLSKTNATGAVVMQKSGDLYTAAVEGIAAKDLDKGVYVAFVYTDGSSTYCSGILGYSIGMYCQSLASGTDTMAPFARATAVYGYYAKQTFY